MLVIEHPTTASNPVARKSIVLIRIDPLASVASLNDEQASREAGALTVKKVLVVYQRNIGLEYSPELNGFKIRAQFLLAGPGLPAAPLSAASLPISPAPSQDARAAIKTTPQLPRDDCYIHTLHSTLVVVSRILQPGSVVGYSLSEEDNMRLELTRMDDHKVHSDALADRYADELSGTGSVVGSRAEPSQYDSEPASGSGASGADLADDLHAPVIHVDEVPPQLELQAELWTELLPDDDLGTPDEFSDLVGRLHEIERECQNRAIVEELAKKPQTNAWLSGISAGPPIAPDRDGQPIHDENGDREVDGLVHPEDAIEHRLEREAAELPTLEPPPVSSADGVRDTTAALASRPRADAGVEGDGTAVASKTPPSSDPPGTCNVVIPVAPVATQDATIVTPEILTQAPASGPAMFRPHIFPDTLIGDSPASSESTPRPSKTKRGTLFKRVRVRVARLPPFLPRLTSWIRRTLVPNSSKS